MIVGAPDQHGHDTDVPEQLHQLLFETEYFTVEVQGASGRWNRLELKLSTWLLAHMLAVEMLQRFNLAPKVRVVPAE